jgi:hypothetical protein
MRAGAVNLPLPTSGVATVGTTGRVVITHPASIKTFPGGKVKLY